MKKILLSCLLLAGVLGASAQGRDSRQRSADIILGGSNSNGSNNGKDGYGYPASGRDDRNDRDWDKDHDDHNRGYANGSNGANDRYRLEEAARRINADYDYRINQVRADRRLRNKDRKRQVAALEQEREDRLRSLYDQGRYARNDNSRGRNY
ncbi:hypothetical protein [Flaviaesturariibacter terrae]